MIRLITGSVFFVEFTFFRFFHNQVSAFN